MSIQPPAVSYSSLFSGMEVEVPLLNGNWQRYINLDSAAFTPALRSVKKAVNRFLDYYSSVHSGMRFKSQLTTHAYEAARQSAFQFLGGISQEHTCIFVKNATEALNILAHHIALVFIAGASNVTGYINPLRRLAARSHSAGAMFSVDAAQLAPDRRIDLGSLDDPDHFDFVTISASKMYAPFGSGVGTVKMVTYDDHVWADQRDEAGSPNLIGAIALAAAMKALDQIGLDEVARHEAELTRDARIIMAAIPGIKNDSGRDADEAIQRLGVIPFEVEGMSHVQVTAVLGCEHGIGACNGRFCAHPYTILLALSDEQIRRANQQIAQSIPTRIPGLVPVSFGLYNTLEDVDRLAAALTDVCERNLPGTCHLDPATGDYIPEEWQVDFDRYYSV